MRIIDIDALLHDLDPLSPCGPNLEYDPDFLALELGMLGKPEVQYGSSITAAIPPEWKLLKPLALDLLKRSRDLRLAVPLLRCLLALHGLAGFADGLAFIERLLQERWDTVHPQLDPDDGMDPMLRINSLAMLGDAATVLKELKNTILIVLPGLGPFSLRSLDIASGELAPAHGEAKIADASLAAALGDLDIEEIKAVLSTLYMAFNSATDIEVVLMRHVGSGKALSLAGLTQSLKHGLDFLQQHVTLRMGVTSEVAQAAQPANAKIAGPARVGGASLIAGDISSPKDVIRTLDKILQYYQQYEPSSPVPLLLRRAIRLVPKNFFEIVNDLAPEGMAQLLVISGPQDEAQ